MSRIGKNPISIPTGVEVTIGRSDLKVAGPKGQVSTPVPPGIEFGIEGGKLLARRTHESQRHRALHGLARALAANAVKGVSEGYEKKLQIVGIGFRASVDGQTAVFNLGYSHEIRFSIPDGIKMVVEKTEITVTGIDKQKVGQVSAEIRRMKVPDVYKGKGIRFVQETIKLKPGKAGK